MPIFPRNNTVYRIFICAFEACRKQQHRVGWFKLLRFIILGLVYVLKGMFCCLDSMLTNIYLPKIARLQKLMCCFNASLTQKILRMDVWFLRWTRSFRQPLLRLTSSTFFSNPLPVYYPFWCLTLYTPIHCPLWYVQILTFSYLMFRCLRPTKCLQIKED